MSNKKLVNIQVLNKEIEVVCPEEEKADLFAAAAYLDKKMREIRNTSKTMDLNRIAIIAALNITHELLALRQQPLQQTGGHTSHPTKKENSEKADLFSNIRSER
jgi:cell division protein ZapA